MAASSSSFIPTPHADNEGEEHPTGTSLHWPPTKFNLYDPERRDQEPTDFVYDVLKLHKQLKLGMSEEALVDHIFVSTEPQVQDYVEVRNPQNTVQLLEVLSKFDIRAKQSEIRGIVILLKDEVGMSVGCLTLIIKDPGASFWKTFFNTWKLIAVLFTRRRKPVTPSTLYATPLHLSQSTNYLGVLLETTHHIRV
ncbi:uncharacterized protein TNCV_2614841 [Trichonephila clavipes]|nr:uncharacterized protein TNCV_2614841 [Trichonephila clavipes]